MFGNRILRCPRPREDTLDTLMTRTGSTRSAGPRVDGIGIIWRKREKQQESATIRILVGALKSYAGHMDWTAEAYRIFVGAVAVRPPEEDDCILITTIGPENLEDGSVLNAM